MGLFDCVSATRVNPLEISNQYMTPTGELRKYRFYLPPNMKFSFKPIHCVSLDEQRAQFAVTDIEGALQIGFRGVHSDVGGSYFFNAFDWISRFFVATAAMEAGVPLSYEKLFFRALNVNWDATPTNNRGAAFDDGEKRRLPRRMFLHPSVRSFKAAPTNDFSRYTYWGDWWF